MSEFVREHAWPKLEGATMTTADKLRAEGGQASLARSLWKLLRAKFPSVSPDLERLIQSADIPQLELCFERVLTAESPEDVVRELSP